MLKRDHNLQSGQVGLITLLLMTVVLSVALSLSLRTIMEQDIAITQDESLRVFNAAESGIEQALYDISQDSISGDIENIDLGANYEIQVDNKVNLTINSGRALEVPLNSINGLVNIHWWNKEDDCSSTNKPAAIVVSVYSASSVKYYGFDPCNRGNFTEVYRNSPAVDFDNDSHYYSAEVTVTSSDVLIRVRPLYNNTKLYITATAFTSAQYNILSSGYGTDEDIARTLDVKRSMPGAPDFMDFALFSGDNLVKN